MPTDQDLQLVVRRVVLLNLSYLGVEFAVKMVVEKRQGQRGVDRDRAGQFHLRRPNEVVPSGVFLLDHDGCQFVGDC